MSWLGDLINENHAALVIIDPLSAFLASDVNSHRDQDIRRALHQVTTLADTTRAAVLIVRHLTKSRDTNALYRGQGSIGVIGAARLGLLIGHHPEDPARRVLAPTKNNLAKEAPSLAFRLDSEQGHAARVRWEGPVDFTAAHLLASPDTSPRAEDHAVSVLLDLLGDGPLEAATVRKLAAESGISHRTLARAKKRLGITSEHCGRPGEHQTWHWQLPDLQECQPDAKDANPHTLASLGTLGTLGPPVTDASPNGQRRP
jgi:hypothetical protein